MAHHHLTIEHLSVSYGEVPALRDVSLELSCGRCVGLLGSNGAGKTTLIKAIAGLVEPDGGTIFYHGRPRHAIARHIAYLPQRGVLDWDFPITVRGMVAMGRYPALGGWRSFGPEDRIIVDEALALTRLRDLAERQINALSGGQQQRAFLARAYAQQAHVFVLDEPFTGLDPASQDDLGCILHSMAAEGKLILVSHHDLKTVPALFDQVVMLREGRIMAFGPTDATFTLESIAGTFASPEVAAR